MTNTSHPKIAFFGTPQIAVWVLEELEKQGIVPALIVTNPDAPQGRKLILTPPPVKVWAAARNISVFQPTALRNEESVTTLAQGVFDLFIVAAYGKIIPQAILDIPKSGTLNVHPSLLPALRGASPIRSAILGDIRETGVTIMCMDAELDHGPILAQERATIAPSEWPLRGHTLDELLARTGGRLLADIVPKWLAGSITPIEQDHTAATFCTKITKEMGEINLAHDPYQNLLKIRAFDGWPGTYFFVEKQGREIRVKIVDAELNADRSLTITRVVPEGKKEMSYEDFLRN
jgi:methionyl-tRNA formyltransferase